MAAEPGRRSRVSQQVVAEICRLIRQGVYRSGDQLPPERELAEQLQVSRPSLREALRVLEMTGIVESRHGGGTFILELFPAGIVSPLSLLLEATGDVVGDLWEMRIIFEPAIAARAAARAIPDSIVALQDLVDQMRDAVASGASDDAVIQIDRDFHNALASASGNQVAVRVLALINELLLEGRRHFITSETRRSRALAAHEAILDAVRSVDAAAARQAMLQHLEEIEAVIMSEVISASDADRGPAEPVAATFQPVLKV
jgi:GntR family transcriptional repressor for pyruvate dehydrogenase complex